MPEPELKTLEKSTRKNKKYMIRVNNKLIHFGDSRYQHYKDSTPLRLYSHLDHHDKIRRKRYYDRHGKTNNKNSAKYWSNKYLW
jgi:hypothetical protein